MSDDGDVDEDSEDLSLYMQEMGGEDSDIEADELGLYSESDDDEEASELGLYSEKSKKVRQRESRGNVGNEVARESVQSPLILVPAQSADPGSFLSFRFLATESQVEILSRANHAGGDRDYDTALRLANFALTRNGHHADCHLTRGKVFFETKKHAEALDEFNLALELVDDDTSRFRFVEISDFFAMRGECLGVEGRKVEAIASLEKAIELNSKDSSCYKNLALLLAEDSRFNEAIARVSTSLSLNPNQVDLYGFRGNLHYEVEDHASAVADFTRAIDNGGHNRAWLFSRRGVSLRNLNRHADAVSDYSRALEIEPGVALVWHDRGVAFRKMRKYERAIRDASKAIQLEPTNPSWYYSRGFMYREIRNAQAAIRDLTFAIEHGLRGPELGFCLAERSYAFFQILEMERAMQDFIEARKITKKLAPSRGVYPIEEIEQRTAFLTDVILSMQTGAIEPEFVVPLVSLFHIEVACLVHNCFQVHPSLPEYRSHVALRYVDLLKAVGQVLERHRRSRNSSQLVGSELVLFDAFELPQDTGVAFFYAKESDLLYRWVWKNGAIVFLDFKQPVTESEILLNVEILHQEPEEFLKNLPEQLAACSRLWTLLFDGLDEHFGENPGSIVIIPDGVLFHVAFACLYDGERFLIEKYAFCVSPSIRMYQTVTARKPAERRNVHQVGGLVAGMPRNPDVPLPSDSDRKEVRFVAEAISDCLCLVGPSFTSEMLRSCLKISSPRILHICTHGSDWGATEAEFKPRGVICASDGTLGAEFLETLALSGTDLVYLSGCETASGNVSDEGLLGPHRSLLIAGASSVLCHHWEFPEKIGFRICCGFYSNALCGLNKAESLRQAILAFLKIPFITDSKSRIIETVRSAPRIWGGFTLIGAPSWEKEVDM